MRHEKRRRERSLPLATPMADQSGVVAKITAEGVRLLHQALARDDLDDVVIVLLVLHVLLLLALHDDDGADGLMVLLAVMHVADKGGNRLALFVCLDDIRRIETAGLFDHARPMCEADVG